MFSVLPGDCNDQRYRRAVAKNQRLRPLGGPPGPVEVTYHGRPELVVLSVEDYALLRQNRKLAMKRSDMPIGKIERIANNRMDAGHADLDVLMDD